MTRKERKQEKQRVRELDAKSWINKETKQAWTQRNQVWFHNHDIHKVIRFDVSCDFCFLVLVYCGDSNHSSALTLQKQKHPLSKRDLW